MLKKQPILIFLSLLSVANIWSQSDTASIYAHLETKAFYDVQLSSGKSDGEKYYEVNGKYVSKSEYNKFDRAWKNMETCCPCILKSYDEHNILEREQVSCTDCGIGWFKDFYQNGKVKLKGQYKQTHAGKPWDDSCDVNTGQWVYFNEKGDTLYSEYWNNGEFVKQVPEQSKVEVWKVEVTFNGKKINGDTISFDQLKELEITPKYKNSTRDSTTMMVRLDIGAIGRRQLEPTFTLKGFKSFDLKKLLSDSGYKSTDRIGYSLIVLYNWLIVDNVNFNIKE